VALPGVSTVIKDRFFSLSRTNIPTGPRVAIIGRRNIVDGDANSDGTNTYANTAAAVPDTDPYNAANEQVVIETFGYGSDLHRGYLEAIGGGAQRITLIALPKDTIFDHSLGTLSSVSYGATLFDDAFAAAESILADIIVPWGRGAGPTEFQNPATPGDDIEIGFHADNSQSIASSWASQVASKCASITANSHPCFAVMGIKPFMGASTATGGMTPSDVNGHIGAAGLTNLADKEAAGLGNNGIYLSVVATEAYPLGYNDVTNFGYSNGAAVYAGAISQLDPWSSPTGKTVYNIESIRYSPTRTQQLSLIGLGVVPLSLDFKRIPRWIDAMTFSKLNSDYTRLTTLRIVFRSVQMVNVVSQKFIGEVSNLQSRNALETAITSGLRGLQQDGALTASDYTITYLPNENKAIIDLVIRPAFELRNIEVNVSVQL